MDKMKKAGKKTPIFVEGKGGNSHGHAKNHSGTKIARDVLVFPVIKVKRQNKGQLAWALKNDERANLQQAQDCF